MFKLALGKAEEPEIKLPTSAESSQKQENSRKTSISALLIMPKPLTVWITINCGKFWKRSDLPLEKPICRSGTTVATGHGTTDWFQVGKEVCQGCILSPCLFNFYAEYIIRNAGLEETQAGIKIAGRNINNLRYADDTTLMAESEEELKSLLMKVKRRVKKLLKSQHSWGCRVGRDWATELNWTEQCRRPGFDLWVRKILWKREWLPTPVFLPGEFRGQRSLAGYSTRGCKESDTTERLTHTYQNSWKTIVVKITVLRIRVYEGEAGDSWIQDQEASSFPVAWYSKIGQAELCPDKKIRDHIFISFKVKETFSAKKFLGGQKGSDV
jgi:hypothetical protein